MPPTGASRRPVCRSKGLLGPLITPMANYRPSTRSTRQLLRDWTSIMAELRKREIIRTSNSPIADIAEALVHEQFGGERGSFSQSGWDVKTPSGERLQVKAMRRLPSGKRRNLSPIRDRKYDAVIAVIFNENFEVENALRLSRELVEELFAHKPYVNGRIISITKALLANPRVEFIELSDALLGD